jgi:hypothetical protein
MQNIVLNGFTLHKVFIVYALPFLVRARIRFFLIRLLSFSKCLYLVKTLSKGYTEMKKLSKLALLAMLLSAGAVAQAETVNNWRDASTGLTWMNGSGEHCWRNAYWTKETASSEKCGKPVAPPPVVVVPEPAKPEPVVQEAPKPVPQISTEKFSFAADTLFEFDKSSLKEEGKAKLNDLVRSYCCCRSYRFFWFTKIQ